MAADRVDRRLDHARRGHARQGDQVRGARRQVLSGGRSGHRCTRARGITPWSGHSGTSPGSHSRWDAGRDLPVVRIGGICGTTAQAVREGRLVRDLGYHAGLLSLAALGRSSEDELLAHCRAVSDIIPTVGFYLQPSVGGRHLSYAFWRRFAELPNVIAIKIAPFNRYQTLDVVRAVTESGRDDIALYTGNDDNIIADLLTPFCFNVNGRTVERRIVGGLL